jgi:hypothetical protein
VLAAALTIKARTGSQGWQLEFDCLKGPILVAQARSEKRGESQVTAEGEAEHCFQHGLTITRR